MIAHIDNGPTWNETPRTWTTTYNGDRWGASYTSSTDTINTSFTRTDLKVYESPSFKKWRQAQKRRYRRDLRAYRGPDGSRNAAAEQKRLQLEGGTPSLNYSVRSKPKLFREILRVRKKS